MRDEALKRSAFELVESHSFAGLSVWGPLDVMVPPGDLGRFAEKLQRRGVPMVVLSEVTDNLPDSVASVTWDATTLSYEATRLLIGKDNHPVGGLFYGISESYHGRNYEGFEKAISEAGLPLREELVSWKVGPEVVSAPSITGDVSAIAELTSSFFIDNQEALTELRSALDELHLPMVNTLELSVLGFPPAPLWDVRRISYVSLPFEDVSRVIAEVMTHLVRYGVRSSEPLRLKFDGSPNIVTVDVAGGATR
jgi:DNA-binding LacI/PurR family transcriptional regulator